MQRPEATMDFFGAQEKAKRKTALLVMYFVAAVILIICGVYSVIIGVLLYYGEASVFFQPDLFLLVCGATLLIVLLGSLYKTMSLRKGGPAVARMLGAVAVGPAPADPHQRQLLNVVEEIAIASGMRMPEVYILEDNSINAFAAGYAQQDAIVCVTRGCLKYLTRDELQGVVAHEFSHILNFDMRLNIRLMGILHGILIISIIGYYLFRVMAHSSPNTSRSSRSNKKDGSLGMALILVGLGLMAVGYIGVFFGNLIKSSISRHREFLADASAVQFTRNPSGIAGALKKIGGLAMGSHINNIHASEASHFFFSSVIARQFLSLMATHPPLIERISRIDHSFDGKLTQISADVIVPVGPEPARSGFAEASPVPSPTRSPSTTTATQIMQSVGQPTAEHLIYASSLLSTLPHEVRRSLEHPGGAEAILYGLLFDEAEEIRGRQQRIIREHANQDVSSTVMKLLPLLQAQPRGQKIATADLALFSLQKIAEDDFNRLQTTVSELTMADNKLSFFELAIEQMVLRQLRFRASSGKSSRFVSRHSMPTTRATQLLLSSLAWAGTDNADEALVAFETGKKGLNQHLSLKLQPQEYCSSEAVREALSALNSLSPAETKALLNACLATISVDDRITSDEAELVRALADSLDCPIPPVLTN